MEPKKRKLDLSDGTDCIKKTKKSSDQKFLPQYSTKWDFIRKSVQGESYARCTLCNKDFSVAASGEYDIKRHISGLKHKQIESARPPTLTKFMASTSDTKSKEEKLKEQTFKAEMTMVNFLCKLNLPIATADTFSKTFREMFPDSEIAKRFSCARTKSTAIAQDLAKLHQDKLFTRMRHGPFTLSTDGSNDDKEKLFPIVVRSINPDSLSVESELLALPVCRISATGENIFNLLDEIIRDNQIPWTNCIALGCDNASVMTGVHKGVYAFIKKKNPEIFLAGCTLHLVHLSAEKAADTLPVSPADMLTDIYYYFRKSSCRQQGLAEFQSFCGAEQKKMLKHAATRWLSIGRCLDRLLENWRPLRNFFDKEKEDKKKKKSYSAQDKVKLISEGLSSQTTRLYTMFLQYSTSLFSSFLTVNQSDAPRIAKLHQSMSLLLRDILKQFVKPCAFVGNKPAMDVDFTSQYNIKGRADILIGESAKTYIAQKKFSEDKLKDFYDHVIVYYQKVATYLKNNLPYNNQMLLDLAITDPDNILCEGLISKVDRFTSRFPVLLQGSTKDELNNAFAELQIMDLKRLDRDDHTWGEAVRKSAVVKPACLFLLGLMTVPHGSAHCERIFSCVRKNHTEFRPLGPKTLEALMIVKHRGDAPDEQYTPEEIKHLRGSCSRALQK